MASTNDDTNKLSRGRLLRQFENGENQTVVVDPYSIYAEKTVLVVETTTSSEVHTIEEVPEVYTMRAALELVHTLSREVEFSVALFEVVRTWLGAIRGRRSHAYTSGVALKVEQLDDARFPQARLYVRFATRLGAIYERLFNEQQQQQQPPLLSVNAWRMVLESGPVTGGNHKQEWDAINAAVDRRSRGGHDVLQLEWRAPSNCDVIIQKLLTMYTWKREGRQNYEDFAGPVEFSSAKDVALVAVSSWMAAYDDDASAIVQAARHAYERIGDDVVQLADTNVIWNTYEHDYQNLEAPPPYFKRSAYFNDTFVNNSEFASRVLTMAEKQEGHVRVRDYVSFWNGPDAFYIGVLYSDGGGEPFMRIFSVEKTGRRPAKLVGSLLRFPATTTTAYYDRVRAAMLSPPGRRQPRAELYTRQTMPVLWHVRLVRTSDAEADLVVNTDRGEELVCVRRRQRNQAAETMTTMVHNSPATLSLSLPVRVMCTENYIAALVHPQQMTSFPYMRELLDQNIAAGRAASDLLNVDLHLFRRQRDGDGDERHELIRSFHSLNMAAFYCADLLDTRAGIDARDDVVARMALEMSEDNASSLVLAVDLIYMTAFVVRVVAGGVEEEEAPSFYHAARPRLMKERVVRARELLLDRQCRGAFVFETVGDVPQNGGGGATMEIEKATAQGNGTHVVYDVFFTGDDDKKGTVSVGGNKDANVYQMGTRWNTTVRPSATDARKAALDRQHHHHHRQWQKRRWLEENLYSLHHGSVSVNTDPLNGALAATLSQSGRFLLTMDTSRTTLFLRRFWTIGGVDAPARVQNTDGKLNAYTDLITVFQLPFATGVVRFSPFDDYLVAISTDQRRRVVLRWRVPVSDMFEVHMMNRAEYQSHAVVVGDGDPEAAQRRRRRRVVRRTHVPQEIQRYAAEYAGVTDLEFWENQQH